MSQISALRAEYHQQIYFALPELIRAVDESGNESQKEMLDMLIEGRRLRDIADLPFDLAI